MPKANFAIFLKIFVIVNKNKIFKDCYLCNMPNRIDYVLIIQPRDNISIF